MVRGGSSRWSSSVVWGRRRRGGRAGGRGGITQVARERESVLGAGGREARRDDLPVSLHCDGVGGVASPDGCRHRAARAEGCVEAAVGVVARERERAVRGGLRVARRDDLAVGLQATLLAPSSAWTRWRSSPCRRRRRWCRGCRRGCSARARVVERWWRSSLPAATILPSGCSATARRVVIGSDVGGDLAVAVEGGVEAAVAGCSARARSRSSAPFKLCPAATILPSGCSATAFAPGRLRRWQSVTLPSLSKVVSRLPSRL